MRSDGWLAVGHRMRDFTGVQEDGLQYRVVAKKNPLCIRSYLKMGDGIPCDGEGNPLPPGLWPDEIRAFDIVRQSRAPGGEWEDCG